MTKNLDRVIDANFYPVPEARNSNMRHRPIGIGVQGLADAFMLMDIPYHSQRAIEINKKIFETIYYAALCESNDIAKFRYEYIKSNEKLINDTFLKYKKDNVDELKPECIIYHDEHFNMNLAEYDKYLLKCLQTTSITFLYFIFCSVVAF